MDFSVSKKDLVEKFGWPEPWVDKDLIGEARENDSYKIYLEECPDENVIRKSGIFLSFIFDKGWPLPTNIQCCPIGGISISYHSMDFHSSIIEIINDGDFYMLSSKMMGIFDFDGFEENSDQVIDRARPFMPF